MSNIDGLQYLQGYFFFFFSAVILFKPRKQINHWRIWFTQSVSTELCNATIEHVQETLCFSTNKHNPCVGWYQKSQCWCCNCTEKLFQTYEDKSCLIRVMTRHILFASWKYVRAGMLVSPGKLMLPHILPGENQHWNNKKVA